MRKTLAIALVSLPAIKNPRTKLKMPTNMLSKLSKT
jgi:hypothetical protein